MICQMKLYLENNRTYRNSLLVALVWLAMHFVCIHASAAEPPGLPSTPTPPRLVVDFTGTLSADATSTLENKLVQFSDSTGNQICVVMINTLNEVPIEDYAYYLARKWGIGKSKNDNGVLLLLVKGDRKARIEVGKGLEGALPDAVAKEIIRVDIAPNFQAGNYDKGVAEAVNSICSATQYEYTDTGQPTNGGEGGFPFLAVLLIMFILLFLLSRMRRNSTHYMSRRGYRDLNGGGFWMFPGSIGGGGLFNGGGGDSGGFGGFGGGDFGGGGASGDW
jgi:uncharacterized protein